jgi:hypothetical protein
MKESFKMTKTPEAIAREITYSFLIAEKYDVVALKDQITQALQNERNLTDKYKKFIELIECHCPIMPDNPNYHSYKCQYARAKALLDGELL